MSKDIGPVHLTQLFLPEFLGRHSVEPKHILKVRGSARHLSSGNYTRRAKESPRLDMDTEVILDPAPEVHLASPTNRLEACGASLRENSVPTSAVPTDARAGRLGFQSVTCSVEWLDARVDKRTLTDLLQRFQDLNVWKSGGKRAPHKPLLALWAIGRCLRGEPRLASYELVDRELRGLLRRFGPHRKVIHTEDPFWRMQRDDVWEVDRPQLVRTNLEGGAYKSDLRRFHIRGGLTARDYAVLQGDPSLARRVAEHLVTSHFPASLHAPVLEAASIPIDTLTGSDVRNGEHWMVVRRRRRDPAFRGSVLEAYGSRCAVCEFALRHDDEPVALEAAHIKWHEAKGPDVVENGLALCTLHHDLFDAGAFTVLPELSVVVADSVQGAGVEIALGRYHGEPLRAPPRKGFPQPGERFLAWHRSEVFREPEVVR